jgi:LacI family transcriptional regulator
MKRITIYDIAKKTNLSPSTVSRVLGNSDYPVSSEMREKILAAARELDYHPNLWARNLKKKTGQTIGVLLPSISNPFFPSIVQGIEDTAYEKGFSLFTCSGAYDPEREANYLRLFIENHVSGVITVLAEELGKGLDDYLRQGGTVVSIQAEAPTDERICSFYFDMEHANYLAANHLLGLGHRRIAYLTAALTSPIRRAKARGYLKALTEAGIEDPERYLYIAQEQRAETVENFVSDNSTGVNLTRRLLERAPEVTAVLCMNDLVALGCQATLQSQGRNIPQDVSLVGFDDLFFAELIKPGLTTVRLEKYKIGQMAMTALIDLIQGEGSPHQVDLSDQIKLVVRETTAEPGD